MEHLRVLAAGGKPEARYSLDRVGEASERADSGAALAVADKPTDKIRALRRRWVTL